MSEEKEQAEEPKSAILGWIVIIFIAGIVLFAMIKNDQKQKARKEASEAENQAAMEEYKKFAECELGLKSTLRSPNSYQLIQYDVYDKLVYIDYKAQNGFGAYLKGKFSCHFKTDESSTEIPKPYYLAAASNDGHQFTTEEVAALQYAIAIGRLSL